MKLSAAVLLALLAGPPVPGGFVEVAEGVRLRVQPSPASRALVTVDASQALEVLEVKDGWVRVRYASFSGWLKPGGDGGEPGLLERLPARNDGRLKQAVRALSTDQKDLPPRPFGPLSLYTDVTDRGVLALLEGTAVRLPTVYADRYGVRALETGITDALVLFEKANGYAALVSEDEQLARTEPRGHASSGFAVLSLTPDGIDESRGLLTHELTHLLNRRALGGLLAPWLEEGLAEDLAMCRFGSDGRPVPDSLRVRVEKIRGLSRGSSAREMTWQRGPLTAVLGLANKARRDDLQPLSTLLSLTFEAFVSGERRGENYAMAALFIRFLLADGLPGSRDAFRGFLGSVSKGDSPAHARLLQSLGTEGGSLDGAFRKWLAALPVD